MSVFDARLVNTLRNDY